MHPTISRPWLFLGVALLVGQIPQAAAFPSYLNTWKGLYPASSSGDNANCALCHNSFSSGSGFNPYGSAVRNASGSTSTQIQAVEGFDSDNDPTGSNNLAEIEASTQPGWTGSAPSGVTGNLDPVATPMPNIVVNPTALNFSTVTVGNSPTLTTTVQNTGTADLNVSGVNLGTGTSTEFGVTSPVGGFTVGAGMSQVVTVQYMPLDMGPDSGSIDINSNDPDSATVSVALSGTGTAPPAPDINLVPAGIDLGTIEIGSFGSQTVSIQNLGDASLGIGPISRCTGTSPEFTWSLANTLVPASGSTTLTVEYTPSGVGTDTGCLEIGSNDPDEPSVQLDVAGTGTLTAVPDIALDPASLDFGALTVNDTATLSAQIRNLGSAALTVTGIAAAPGTSGEYAVTAPTTPFTIAAGNSETLSVAYTPTDEGLDTGSVALSS
ncbi:MAG: choice-of-anchor D domain-containing protein, partial [Chromatiales bacterium]